MFSPFSLILGGGSARGIAHIWVIQRLEELRVTPTEVVGTSMWAIVWAFYSAGFSTERMKKVLEDMTFLKLVDFDMGRGGIQGKKVMQFLRDHLGEIQFADLKIPLTIIAVNINSGETILFRTGNVIDAIRASISIPGVFVPFQMHHESYIDGGITANLPIEYARKQEKKVIAVSVYKKPGSSSDIVSDGFFSNTPFARVYKTLQKSLDIILLQNEVRSIATRKDALVLYPENTVEYHEFDKWDILIQSGYDASQKIEKYLQKKRSFPFFQ